MSDHEQETVLVTGACGFIGCAVRKLLQREGYDVVAVDLAASRAVELSSSEQDLVLDITDADGLKSVFQARAITTIIHLAAILPTAAQHDPGLATRVNIHGSLNVLEMAREFGVRRVVFGSSLSVYGTCQVDHVVSEQDRAAPEDLYGAAKLYVERMGEAYRESYGMEFVGLRIGRVVGPGARSATSAWRSKIFELLGASGPAEIVIPYTESERILLVHVEDVAKMLVELVRASQLRHTVYNAACESVMVAELKREIEKGNPRMRVRLEGRPVVGNPRRVDWARLAGEFRIDVCPIFEQLARAERRS